MYPELFHIGSFTVYSYGLMIAVGIVTCVLLADYREKKANMPEGVIFNIAIAGVIGGFLGAKLLYWITIFPLIRIDPSIMLDFANGFVVFGGLIGGVLSAMLYCKITKREFLPYFDLAAPSIALAQGFGRLGCLFAGCCYGQTSEFGFKFSHSDFAPHDVTLFPIQLVSSGLNFLNFFFLSWIWKHKRDKKGLAGGLYIMTYSIGRFILEFFRGDIERGSVGILSTSQFIAIFTTFIGVVFLIYTQRLNKEKSSTAQESEK